MDPVQEAVATFDAAIAAQSGKRHRNPRLNQLLQKVEEVLEQYTGEQVNKPKPEEQVFGIDLVLELILDNLDSGSLFNCRSVTKQWNKTSTKILNSRRAAYIRVDYSGRRFVVNGGVYPQTELNYLSNFISTHCNGTFPWTTFYIRGCGGRFEDAELQNFLSEHGWNIKNLYLGIDSVRLSHFKRLLVEQVPNVEDLTIGVRTFEESNLRLFSEPREELRGVLGNLKKLQFTWSKPPKFVVTDILKVGARLQSVTGSENNVYFPGKILQGISWNSTAKSSQTVSTYYVKRILESGRIEILKNMDIQFFCTISDPEGKVKEFCTNLLQRNPKFSRLRICGEENFHSADTTYTNEEISILSKLLTSAADTLEVLYTSPLSLLQGIKFPKLPILKHLVFNNGKSAAFPPPAVFNVSESLPQLTTMTIDFSRFFRDERDPNLKEKMRPFLQNLMDHSIESVKNVELQFCDFHCPLLLPSVDFNIAFPNMTQLSLLSGLLDFQNEAKALWTLSKLKSLEFSIQLNCQGNIYPAIDCGFTGFAEETCCQLYEVSYDEDSSGLNPLRESKSLLDMENLEFLTLEVIDFDEIVTNNDDEVYRSRIITPVTGLFAFRMCPQLRIKLCGRLCMEYKERFSRVLRPILPYVHSVDWKDFND